MAKKVLKKSPKKIDFFSRKLSRILDAQSDTTFSTDSKYGLGNFVARPEVAENGARKIKLQNSRAETRNV